MAGKIHKLRDADIRPKKLKTRRLSDGAGLYLNQAPGGAKSWVFMWSVVRERLKDGQIQKYQYRREMGLGGYPHITLERARKLAQEKRELVAAGLDPIEERKRDIVISFGEVADEFINSTKSQWTNPKHAAQWRSTLETYCAPIWNLPIEAVGTDAVLSVLKDVWQTKQETVSRLRGRIERVIDYAIARGWRQGDNPARWKGHLKNILPGKPKGEANHFAAMNYGEVPAFIANLKERKAVTALALEFTILTAVRTSETLNSTWNEMDLENALWVIPAERMKLRREHRVPLTSHCVDILNSLLELRTSDYVFPGNKRNKPISNMGMNMLLRRMGVENATVHGFRSAFRDWAGDNTSFPRELAEQCLAHAVGDATEQAYRRSDALEKRRKLMEAWASFCKSKQRDNVISLVR